MKKLMIAAASLILVVFAGMIIYVVKAPDFEEPLKASINAVPPEDNEIWTKTVEDLAEYLYDLGLVESTELLDFYDCDMVTRWVGIGSDDNCGGGVEFAYWDLENLDKDGKKYRIYKTAVEEGIMDGGSAFQLPATVHGPFAFTYVEAGYTGDLNALMDAFNNYCMDSE